MAKFIVAVRYGLMCTIENFQTDIEGLKVNDTVIIKTERGIEWGEISAPPESLDREIKGLGEVSRHASESDIGIIQHIQESKEPEELDYCKQKIRERNLPMKLVGVEHLFSGDKVIFFFLADGRVDFRELVKDLARTYRTRIEMRQIGVRDEARMLADYEHCGRELCCRTFLRNLEPVTMRMAKVQKTTLDPSKISGHCGRLMCCLRFEDVVYTDLRKELPKKGKLVRTPQFRGEVISHDVLKQLVLLKLDDGGREWIHISEITEILNKVQNQQPQQRSNDERKGNRNKRDNRRERNQNPSSEGGENRSAPKDDNEYPDMSGNDDSE
ncbi:MAG: hypothetical protein JXR97_00485 [Planctomycetes bacterium]|nr:hypothetical protein [Planctomycetota bacterium]